MNALEHGSSPAIPKEDLQLLTKISNDLPILADMTRADLQLYTRTPEGTSLQLAQVLPHSVTPIYKPGEAETRQGERGRALIQEALINAPSPRMITTLEVRGAMVARQLYPVRNARKALIGVLVKDAHWLAHERHKRRSRAFQGAVEALINMVLRGDLSGAETLTAFGEYDGVVYIGADRTVRYTSGVAAGLYRRLGYRDSIVGHRINDLSVADQQIAMQALAEARCVETQVETDGLTWNRKAIPITEEPRSWWQKLLHRQTPEQHRVHGVLLLVHDATEAIMTQREIESKMSLIREVHHRVKNNLQVVASLMRMQARRVESQEARDVLEQSLNRVLSVAVVHEFLSQNASGLINLQEVANRIITQMHQGLIDPSRHIKLQVTGDTIWLPAERATQCSLVINELVQNALDHGLAHRNEGEVIVQLLDLGDQVEITVQDNGRGLPEGFNLDANSNLGLRIVRNLVERDLHGTLRLESGPGTLAKIVIRKSVLGG